MKNIIFTGALSSVLLWMLSGCGETASVVSGTIKNSPSEYMIARINGATDSIRLDADGKFNYEYSGDPGIVYLTIPKTRIFSLNAWLEGGKNTEIILDCESLNSDNQISGVSLTGDAIKELDFFNSIGHPVINPDAFPRFLKYSMKLLEWQDSVSVAACKVNNRIFTDYVSNEVVKRADDSRMIYYRSLAKRGRKVDSDTDYNTFMNEYDINNGSEIYHYLVWKSFCGSDSVPDVYSPDYYAMLRVVRDNVTNQDVRDEYAFRLLRMFMTSRPEDSLSEEVTEMAEGIASPHVKDKINEFASNSMRRAGDKIENFDMLAPDGKMVDFYSICNSDIVYVDVWSTWCGPCCKEIPYVAKLVEHYRDNNQIKFVSISIDKNLDSWHNFIKKHETGWEQFVIPDEKQDSFLKQFAINGIPRFMVFDKKAGLINQYADKPSSNKITQYLDSLIIVSSNN